jgi:protein TonB
VQVAAALSSRARPESAETTREPDAEVPPLIVLLSYDPWSEALPDGALDPVQAVVAPPSEVTATSIEDLASAPSDLLPPPRASSPTRAEPARKDSLPEPEEDPIEIGSAIRATTRVDESKGSPEREVEIATEGTAMGVSSTLGDSAESDAAGAPDRLELLALLHEEISRHRRYPALARRQQREGTATVRFELEPSGRILDVDVVGSSGFQSLDRAALAAVKEVSPFRPASTYLQAAQRFEVRVVFELE